MAATTYNAYNNWNSKLRPNVYNPPPTAKYVKSIGLDDYVLNNVGSLIGDKGKVFNAITRNSKGMLYIWYNNETNEVEMHGNSMRGVLYATKKIKQRVEAITKN